MAYALLCDVYMRFAGFILLHLAALPNRILTRVALQS